MNNPVTKISPQKIKEKSYLLYKVQQKHNHWKIPKCALLIGAGCSYPVIPLGSGLIKICQQLSFIRDEFPLKAADLHDKFLTSPNVQLLEKFIKEEIKTAQSFETYVQDRETIISKNVSTAQVEELKKIQSIIPDAIWDDFETHVFSDARYGFWMDTYTNSPRERQRLIEALIEGNNPSGAYIILALMIEKGFFNNILTTNFDDFINDTLSYYTAVRTRFFADDELSQFISLYGNKPNIIKLHGDYRYANIKNTNEETFRLSNSMEEKLRELLLNLDLIVIGYNGADYSIMKVLQQVKSPNCELLWCGLDETNVHWRVANLINNTSNSWFIKIKGFDDIVKDFYLQFVQSPPNLRKQAEERQDEIARYIKEFTNDLQQSASTQTEKEILKTQEMVWELFNKTNKETNVNKKMSLYNEIIGLDDKFKDAYVLRGYLYIDKENDFDKAIVDFTKAISLNDKEYEAYRGRGWAYTEKKNYPGAIQDLNYSIQLIEQAASVSYQIKSMNYNTRGYYFLQIKDYLNAIKDLLKSIEVNPYLKNPYLHLARVYYEQERLDESLEVINKAIELDNSYKSAFRLRAEIYRRLNEPANAELDEKKVIQLENSATHTI